MDRPVLRPGSLTIQRRSKRILLSVPLQVSGKRYNGAAFAEDVSTLVVNAHGCLILLKEPVSLGQALLLKNLSTGELLSCMVKDINPGANGFQEVGAGFAEASASFWHVSFPPPDWTARSPEAKRIEEITSAL